MTLSRKHSRPMIAIAAASIWSLATIGTLVSPSAAHARGNDIVYSAELAEPMEREIIVAGGVAWACGGTTCTSTQKRSRPEIMCRKLARKTGAITAFAFKDRSLDVAKIAKCNG